MAILFSLFFSLFNADVVPINHWAILVLFFPLLPCVPVLVWWTLNKNASSSRFHSIQEMLRAQAGQDELLMRELEQRRESGKSREVHERHRNFGVDK